MLQKPHELTVVTSWLNGRAATVHLLANGSGGRVIMKVYRPGFMGKMFRDYAASRYVARRLSIVPKVLAFKPTRREIFFSYVPGQRVLEWVLERFGDKDLVLREFQSFHGLDTNEQVAEAFLRFRQSSSEEAYRLKQAIKKSYLCLHGIGMLHGSGDPRNIIYDGDRAFIIDFDHSRPSFSPAKLECRALTYWYGIAL
jgi:hypothetical protein